MCDTANVFPVEVDRVKLSLQEAAGFKIPVRIWHRSAEDRNLASCQITFTMGLVFHPESGREYFRIAKSSEHRGFELLPENIGAITVARHNKENTYTEREIEYRAPGFVIPSYSFDKSPDGLYVIRESVDSSPVLIRLSERSAKMLTSYLNGTTFVAQRISQENIPTRRMFVAC